MEIAEDTAPQTQQQSEERRALELQADAMAIQALVQPGLANIDALRNSEARFFNIQTSHDWFVACLSAAFICYGIMEIADRASNKPLNECVHPSAKCRAITLLQVMMPILVDMTDDDSLFRSTIRIIFNNLTVTCAVLEVQPPEAEAFKWVFQPSLGVTCETVAEVVHLANILEMIDTQLKSHQFEIVKYLQL